LVKNTYRIKLDNFEGPLDLLLFFIHRDQINIYDIPISSITQEFLDYIQLLKSMNIELAGDFILMAALLMKLKAKMLLPVESNNEDEFDDPRTDLVQRLLEYQRFKEASNSLSNIHQEHSYHHPKGIRQPVGTTAENPSEFVKHITLVDLLKVYKNIIDRLPTHTPYSVNHEEIHLEDQLSFIRKKISKCKKILFSEIIKTLTSRLQIIVTFMALLEMLRIGELKLFQKEPFSDIMLEGNIT
jgi:segregation and condensation protein A